MDLVSYEITKADIDSINQVLAKLLNSVALDIVVVGDEGGRLITFSPYGEDMFNVAQRFCVISASVLGALDQLDNLLQSKSNFFTEGLNGSIYIKLSNSNFFISVKFGRNVMLGTVKLFVDRAAKELEPVFIKIRESSSKKFSGIKFDMLEI
ncbi:MAG: hypothetical protein ABWJ98_06180 [Hydrogenothermaceae bacterium]